MPPSENTYQNLLYDLSARLKEDALEALDLWQQSLTSDDPTDKAFHDGQMLAYYKVLSVLKHEAIAFGLPADHLNWGDFDPNRHILQRESHPGAERSP